MNLFPGGPSTLTPRRASHQLQGTPAWPGDCIITVVPHSQTPFVNKPSSEGALHGWPVTREGMGGPIGLRGEWTEEHRKTSKGEGGGRPLQAWTQICVGEQEGL